MHRDNQISLRDRAYTREHLDAVRSDIRSEFDRYFADFTATEPTLGARLKESKNAFRKEQESYLELFSLDSLEEYSYDPNAFKADLKKRCPIVRRCLNSRSKVMDSYRSSFYASDGADLLRVVEHIVRRAHRHAASFDSDTHETIDSIDDLGLTDLDDDDYTAYGVIGGGIRSRFLHMLYPRMFPNRGQNAVWALYFLTKRKDYGFRDGSEFLMIETERAQQNFFYPYDLFGWHSLDLIRQLRSGLASEGVELQNRYRYLYLDSFFDHVAESNRDGIQCLLGVDEYDHDISY